MSDTDDGLTRTDSPHWPIYCLGILLFFIALPLPVFETINPEGDFEDRCHGWEALLLGWAGILGANFAWFANPLMMVVAVLMHFKKWIESVRVANIAAGCSLMTFLWTRPFRTGEDFEKVLNIGAWFWFAAIACFWWSSFVAWRHHAPAQRAEPQIRSA